MKLKLLNFNDSRKNYECDLSAINKEMWECFISEIVIIDCSNLESVSSAQAAISIRDNRAKIKVEYQDEENHKLNYSLSPTMFNGEHKEKLLETWCEIIASIRRNEIANTIQAENNIIQD